MAAAEEVDTELEVPVHEGRHRMPDYVRAGMIRLKGKAYLPTAYRLVWFRDEHPDWSILTEVVTGSAGETWAMVRATIMDTDARIIAQATKTETKEDFPAGWLEKAETGAIGRALAMCGYGTQFDVTLEDGGVVHPVDSPLPERTVQQAPGKPPIWEGPGQCPRCHAPAGKPHATSCFFARMMAGGEA